MWVRIAIPTQGMSGLIMKWSRTFKKLFDVFFLLKHYVIKNVKFYQWSRWFYSQRSKRLYVVVDLDELYEKYRIVSQFRENYEQDFGTPLYKFIRNRYAEYAGDVNAKITGPDDTRIRETKPRRIGRKR